MIMLDSMKVIFYKKKNKTRYRITMYKNKLFLKGFKIFTRFLNVSFFKFVSTEIKRKSSYHNCIRWINDLKFTFYNPQLEGVPLTKQHIPMHWRWI